MFYFGDVKFCHHLFKLETSPEYNEKCQRSKCRNRDALKCFTKCFLVGKGAMLPGGYFVL